VGGLLPLDGWRLHIVTLVGGSDATVATSEGEAACMGAFGRQHHISGGLLFGHMDGEGLAAGHRGVGLASATATT
jgi:hypothetical protein